MPRRPIGRRPKHPFRRPLRGPMRRPGMRIPIPSGRGNASSVLMAAHQLFRSGNYKEAGKAYYRLAEQGITHNRQKAPMLYFQAARSYFLLGKLDTAMKILRKAIEYLAGQERWADMYRGVKSSVKFLNEKGYKDEALAVEHWVTELMPSAVFQNLELSQKEREAHRIIAQLPVHCPTCGGPINPKEVEWVDDRSAICDFCGSIVREE